LYTRMSLQMVSRKLPDEDESNTSIEMIAPGHCSRAI
jgi:hypothetical protein